MQRRHFLLLAAAVPPVIWLGGVGEVVLTDRFVIDRSGRCSFCNRSPLETQAMAGVIGGSIRICSECVALCCELIGEDLRSAVLARNSQRRPSRAERELEELIQARPNDVRSWLRLGDEHAKAGHLDEATACYLHVAKVFDQDGFPLKSIAVLKQVVKLSPSRLDARMQMALLLRELDLLVEAQAEEKTVKDMLGGAVETETPRLYPPEKYKELACSFCLKRQREVRKLIAGPMVYICDGCIALAAGLLRRSAVRTTPS